MKMHTNTIVIVAASVGVAATLGVVAVNVWNSRRFRAMRAVRRTNAVLHRIGNTLCKISETTEGCMA